MKTMKAVIHSAYGPPEIQTLADVAMPQPAANEVLIRVHAATVNRSDTGFRSAKYFVSRIVTGLLRPRRMISGSEFAGEVVEIGSDVRDYTVGDRVFGFDDLRGSGHAQYMTERADGPMAKIPADLSYKQCAPAGEGATYALNVIHAAKIANGQKVMVYGASGAIGSAAVQILKHMNVYVTAVCGTETISAVKTLGADKVIDYRKTDFTATDKRYDLVFDAVGKSSYGVCKKLLKPGGIYYSSELGAYGQNPMLAIWFAITGSRRVIFPIPKINRANIEYIASLLETGSYRPLIDRTYPIDQIVEATHYVESGQKIGNVIITIDHNNKPA